MPSNLAVNRHRAALAELDDWDAYLRTHSNLPGPRANLELLAAVGDEADARRAEVLVESGEEYLQCCGLVALGRLLGEGEVAREAVLHRWAGDERWRVREAVAMALQRAGDVDLDVCFEVAGRWASDPDPLVRRAAVAAVCEPRLIRDRTRAASARRLVEQVTTDLAASPRGERSSSSSARTLRQALGYAWSVAVAADPEDGLPAFARLERSPDVDVQWIVRENKKKARLRRLLAT